MNPATVPMTITDADLLGTFLKGDRKAAQQAFQDLVGRYERLVWTICRRQLKHHSDIEDAFQTTFLRLALSARKIRNPQSLSSWLYGVALRTCMRIRSQQRRQPDHPAIDDVLSRVATDDSPFDAVARQSQIETVDHQLALLDEIYRTPLVLYYFADLSIREIAERLGISRTATEGRLRRGRARLRVALSAQGIAMSPLMAGFGALPMMPRDSDLIARTCDHCIAAMDGMANTVISHASLIAGGFNTGNKLMIMKYSIATALIALFAIGGLMHGPQLAADHQPDTVITMTEPQEEAGDPAVELTLQEDPPTHHELMHEHMMQIHNEMLHHVHHLLHLLHGPSE